MRYAYPCLIEPDLEEFQATGREAYVISFRDVCGANSGGWSWGEALAMAEDCLGVALAMYVDENEALPAPSALRSGEVMIAAPPIAAAKLALLTAMREQGITPDLIAEELGIDERATRRLLDPRYRTHLSTVQRALSLVGRALIVEDCAIAPPPSVVSVGERR